MGNHRYADANVFRERKTSIDSEIHEVQDKLNLYC